MERSCRRPHRSHVFEAQSPSRDVCKLQLRRFGLSAGTHHGSGNDTIRSLRVVRPPFKDIVDSVVDLTQRFRDLTIPVLVLAR